MNSGTPVVKASGLLWDLGLLEPQLWSFCGLLDQRSTPAADLQPKSTWPFGAMCYGLDIKCPLQAHGSEHLFPAILLFGNMRPRRWKQVSWVFGGSSLFSLLPAHSNVAKTFLLASYHTLPTTAAALPCFLYHDGPRETVSSSKAFSQRLKKICLFLFFVRTRYLSVYHMHAWCLQRPEGHWVSWNWSNRWFWKQSLIVLKEQQVLLMAEPSFQPHLHPLKLFLSGILTTRMRKVTAIKFWEIFFFLFT